MEMKPTRSDFWTHEKLEDRLDFVRRHQRWLYVGIIILVALYMIRVSTWLVVNQIREKERALKIYTSTFQQERAEVPEKEQLDKEIRSLEGQLFQNRSQLFSPEEFSAFTLTVLPNMAERHRLVITSETFPPSEPLFDTISMVPINLAVYGRFDALVRLLYALETFQKVIQIDSFTMSRRSLNPTLVTCSVRLRGFVKK
ncbi:MAG: hypothetical protein AAB066_04010 [Candidatus Margulisiibacteriota bacterium]